MSIDVCIECAREMTDAELEDARDFSGGESLCRACYERAEDAQYDMSLLEIS